MVIPELPKFNYADFYRFVMSASIWLFLLSGIAVGYIQYTALPIDTSPISVLLVFMGCCVFWSALKWHERQKVVDEYEDWILKKTRAEARIASSRAKELESSENTTRKIAKEKEIIPQEIPGGGQFVAKKAKIR